MNFSSQHSKAVEMLKNGSSNPSVKGNYYKDNNLSPHRRNDYNTVQNETIQEQTEPKSFEKSFGEFNSKSQTKSNSSKQQKQKGVNTNGSMQQSA